MRKVKRVNAKYLNSLWEVGAKKFYYHKDGRWYHCLSKFPGALFDSYGYILFKTREAYERCPQLNRGVELNVSGGISSIKGYVKMSDEPIKR